MNKIDINFDMNYQTLILLEKESLITILLSLILEKANYVKSTVEWHSVSTIANMKSLSPDAVRKQLQNGT